MKRTSLILFVVIISMSFLGCDLRESQEVSSLSAGQQKAFNNIIEFISNSSFTSKDSIDLNIINITNATENTWKTVFYKASLVKENEIDSTDWIFTIGNTFSHDFVRIVCDSSTYEVIGYIPIE